MVSDPQKLNDGTEVTIPLRNLISIVAAVVLATSAYFSIVSRIQSIEQEMAKDKIVMDMNTEFRILWPRGELGALPADARQDMLIEGLERRLEEVRKLPSSAQPDVDRLTIRVDALIERVVKLEQKVESAE
jgi:polyhydroxyalkanoate synthesis regulator phasin